MKKILIAGYLLLGSLFAADYSNMTLEEMLTKRGDITVEDKDAFKTEMQNKMQELTPEQRAELRGSKGKGNGPGSGNKYKGSNKKGGGMGGR
ncbi:MAG: hypothetical protein U9Q33_12670 [Campylobacterota bacterium]|nr:hypothetical protein [Campylobacterota bacterium]